MVIHLQPFERSDFGRLMAWVPTEEILMLWSGPFFKFPLDQAQLEAYYLSGQSDPPLRCIYKAVDDDNGEVIGHIELNNIDWRNLSASVSKVLLGVKNQQNKGYGTQMVNKLVVIAFTRYRLHRLELRVFDFNASAIRCYEKAGFRIEGHLHDYRKVGKVFWSSYLMALLEPDWKRRREKNGD
jgi:RimJ/RimL family protein N-acetyltransferase